jgi:hypothetical protein
VKPLAGARAKACERRPGEIPTKVIVENPGRANPKGVSGMVSAKPAVGDRSPCQGQSLETATCWADLKQMLFGARLLEKRQAKRYVGPFSRKRLIHLTGGQRFEGENPKSAVGLKQQPTGDRRA